MMGSRSRKKNFEPREGVYTLESCGKCSLQSGNLSALGLVPAVIKLSHQQSNYS